MSKIILKCILEKNKLRIKFHMFIDDNGKQFSNAYNNSFNCQFPKDIRVEGRYFEIGGDDLTTVINRGKPFYRVKRKNIKILENYLEPKFDIQNIKIYSVDECVVCYCEIPSIINIPCGHQCTCSECFELIKKDKNKCPLCRKDIINYFKNSDN